MSATAERILAELGPAQPPTARRLRAALAHGLPSARDENWKYASLRGLERLAFRNAAAPDERTLAVATALLPARLAGHARLVLVDGHAVAALSDAPFTTLAAAVAAPVEPAESAANADGRFAEINAAFSPATVEIGVQRGDTRLIELCCVTTVDGQAAAAHPNLRLRVAAQGQLTLVERHLSTTDATALTNVSIDAQVAAQGRLQWLRLQQQAARSQFVETLQVDIARDARLDLVQVALGALSARTTARIALREAGAECAYHAALLADGQRVQDAYVRVEHQAPHTRTTEFVRGIAADRARIAFNGHISMARGASGAESEQSLRGLLGGAQCEIDLRPQLEIYVDAVKASHGATTGKLDENMLFYLLSRGIDRGTAQGLLKWAFIADVLTRIGDASLRGQVEREVAARLSDIPAAELIA